MTPDCRNCIQSMQSADLVLMCRLTGKQCFQETAKGCPHFIREAGADAEEQPWYSGGWCVEQGRGD